MDSDRGSMTIYFTLMMAVMVSLLCGLILSVKVSGGRARAVNSLDQALYSLLAHYDRRLEKRFGLFFLDAGGSDAPNLAACMRQTEEAADYILDPGRGRITGAKSLFVPVRTGSAVTGYTLATDGGGLPYKGQAVRLMKDTVGIRGITLLKEKMRGSSQAQTAGEAYLSEAEGLTEEGIRADAAESSADGTDEGGEAGDGDGSSADVTGDGGMGADGAGETGEAGDDTKADVPEDFVDPLPVLEALKEHSLLDLVLPDPSSLSEKSVDPSMMVSGRPLCSGFGVVDGRDAEGGDLYFKAYLLTYMNSFTDPSKYSGLAYQIEYLLAGKESDAENLKTVVQRLLLMREPANIACLYTDPAKSAELTELAMLIAAAIAAPEAEPLIKLLLAALWAYAESLVDVRALLSGNRVPLIKSAATWQTDAEGLAKSGGSLEGLARDDPSGFSYKEYLAMLMMADSGDDLTMRAMDMTESEIRGMGNTDFKLDHCLTSFSMEMEVKIENFTEIKVEKGMSYADL